MAQEPGIQWHSLPSRQLYFPSLPAPPCKTNGSRITEQRTRKWFIKA